MMRVFPLLLLAAACSSASAPKPSGRIVVVLTLDWEGVELAPDGFAAIDELRAKLGPVPITHFVSAAYATKEPPLADAAATIARAVHPGDELAVHLHAWRSLARAAGIEPKTAPSFLSGTEQVLEFGDGDAGFDTDLDTYDVPALRALLRTSRHVLEQTHLHVSTSFRAGGYLATPKMLLALGDEGFTVDSSAVDVKPLRGSDDALAERLAPLWSRIDSATQPFVVRGGAMQPLLELPISAVVDYVSTSELVQIFDAAHARLRAQPERDVFVVLAFHLETASDFAGRLADAFATIRTHGTLGEELTFVTVERAAELAQFALAASPGAG